MRKAALLYNPDSGGSKQRQRELQSALEILRGGGVDAELFASHSPEQADELTRQAMTSGCDTIFACGGDGTINNIAQILAKTPVALGILPIGTANALAHDLRLPLKIPAAAKTALHAERRRVLRMIRPRADRGVALQHLEAFDRNDNDARRLV